MRVHSENWPAQPWQVLYATALSTGNFPVSLWKAEASRVYEISNRICNARHTRAISLQSPEKVVAVQTFSPKCCTIGDLDCRGFTRSASHRRASVAVHSRHHVDTIDGRDRRLQA